MSALHVDANVQQRRDSEANWDRKNPILLEGQVGVILENGWFKIGDGVRRWSQLKMFKPEADTAGGQALAEHVNSPTPHPAYDDLASLTVLFENGLV